MSHETLENLLHEERSFPPSEEFAANAVATADLYDAGAGRPARLLGRAGPRLTWATPGPRRSTGATRPFAKWFVGGKLNVAYNCVDRHVEAGHGDRVAIHFEGEPGDTRAHHLRRPAARGLPGRQRADRARRAARATGSRSTCR